MSPITWIGTCENPVDGKSYIISYNDCCGKSSCGNCLCMRSEGDRIQGLTLITSDDEEAVVINLMGHLNPENWTEVMEALDVDSPDVEVAPEKELAPM